MLKFIAKLFAAETRTSPNTKANLSLDAMEARYAPASIAYSGTTTTTTTTRSIIVEGGRIETPGTTNGIIAITQPTTTRGIIVEGG